MTTPRRVKKPFWIILSLFILFGVPLIMAAWMAAKDQPLVTHTTNYGELISPPLSLASLALPANQQAWRGRWLLLYVNPEVCDTSCEKALYNIRQIRTATGKNSDRVARAMMAFSEADPHLQQLLANDFEGTLYLTPSKAAFATLVQGTAAEKRVLQEGGIYLVDPLGNIMMFYPLDSDPMGILKDLTRLLKLSHIG